MTTKLLPALVITLLAFMQLQGQPGSSATASMAADIVEAVGTRSGGDLISYVFYPLAEPEKNRFVTGGRRSGNSFWAPLVQNEHSASFQITGAQYGYSISTNFDPFIPHQLLPGAYLKIRSLQLTPDTRAGSENAPCDRFLLEAILEPVAGQAAGHYQSLQPGRITIHFN